MKYICKNLKEVEQIAKYKSYDYKLPIILNNINRAIKNEPEDKDHIQIQFKMNNIENVETMMFCVGKCISCPGLKERDCEDNKLKEVNVNQMFRELKLKRII